MRILHVIDTLDPIAGGPGVAAQQIALASIAMGHKVDIVSLDPPSTVSCNLPELNVIALGRPGAGRFRYSPQLRPWLHRNARHYDCAVLHGVWTYSVVGTGTLLRRLGVPHVVFTHGMLDPWFRRAFPAKHLKKQLYWLLALRATLEAASSVIFTTLEEKTTSRNSFFPRLLTGTVVRFGTADAPPNVDEQKAAFLKRFPKLAGRSYFLFLGRLHAKKGCDLLIQAYLKHLERHADYELVMAGPDNDHMRLDLESMIPETLRQRVHWTGMLVGDEKWGALRLARAFVLPSHSENFGIAVAEAMACSCPVLISDRVNIWREVSDGGAGVVEKDDLKGTQSLLATFVNLSRDRQLEMGNAGRRVFLAQFEITAATVQLNGLLQSLIEHGRN